MASVPNNKMQPKTSQDGVVLIEALVAILLFSLGVLALAGLQATVVRHSTEARTRSEAAYIAQKTLGKMWADPKGVAAGDYLLSGVTIPELPSGQMTIESPKIGEWDVTVSWALPGETTRHKVVVVGTIMENQQ